jgi:hypothetical protein
MQDRLSVEFFFWQHRRIDMKAFVKVLALTEKGVQCVVRDRQDEPFWLPRNWCKFQKEPDVGICLWVDVPDWNAKKHKQLTKAA